MQKLNEVSVSRADLELFLVYGHCTQESCDAFDRLDAAINAPIEPVEPVAYLDLSKLLTTFQVTTAIHSVLGFPGVSGVMVLELTELLNKELGL